MKLNAWVISICCCAALGFVGTHEANAQQSESAAAEGALEEVVVTAQRRSEQLENVPMSVTEVDTATLEKASFVDARDLGRLVVGTQLNFAGAYLQPSIRGVTTLTNGNNVENNVAIYVDGFYDPNSVTIDADLANIADVEVLKGPQGTLWGRNATGGAILINTRGPSQTFTANAEASYGRFNTQTYNGFVAGPITDHLRYSVSAYHRGTDGYMDLISPTTVGATISDRGAPGRQDSVRLKLEADVGDSLTVNFGYNYGYNSDDSVVMFPITGYAASYVPAPPLRPTQFGTVAYNGPVFQFAIKNESTLKLAYKTGIGTLTSYTGYSVGHQSSGIDFDGTYANIVYFTSRFNQNTFQESLDYNITAIDKLDLIVGASYYHDEIKNPADNPVGAAFSTYSGPALSSFIELDQKTQSEAFYLDATYHLTDKWSLDAGGRYSYETKDIDFAALSAPGVFAEGPLTNGDHWGKFTPRATLRYELADRTDLYASWSKGFRGGNYSATGPVPGVPYAPSKPESISAYEVGFKTAQSIFRFDTAFFYYDYTDLNVTLLEPNPLGGNGVVQVFSNAPSARIYGWDSEIAVQPVSNLNVRAGLELLHARYQNFPNAAGTGVNATNTANVSSELQNWDGQQMARSPNVSGNVGADYKVPLQYGSLLLATNANFTSSFVLNDPSLYGPQAPTALQNQQRYRQGEYALLSAQLTWTDPSEHYFLQVYGTNLTDHTYRLNYSGSALGDYGPMAPPLQFGGKIGVKF